MVVTFSLTVFAWIFFRAKDVTHAFSYIGQIFSGSLFTVPQVLPTLLLVLILIFLIIEWLGREQQYAIAHLGITWNKPARWAFYFLVINAILLFQGKEQQFIYFQF